MPPMPGIMPMMSVSGPIFFTCWICARKSFRSIVPGAHPLLQRLRLLSVDRLLRLLDQAEHVAHAEDARGEAVGMERLEGVDLLAGADELDRQAGDRADRERRAAAGIAVHLGDDEAADVQRLVELLGDVHRLLAGHGVDDEEHFVGREGIVQLLRLRQHLRRDLHVARRVDDEDVGGRGVAPPRARPWRRRRAAPSPA